MRYTGTSTCCPRTSSCLIAAGRYTSHAAKRGFLPRFFNIRASLPAVVVLPAPCSPTSIITVNPEDDIVILLCVPPKSSVSSSRTILITVWSGFRLPKTSSPTAFSRTWAIKSFATLKLTSASRRARRTSRSALSISLSESLPFPRRSLKADCSLSPKFSKGIRPPQSVNTFKSGAASSLAVSDKSREISSAAFLRFSRAAATWSAAS